MVAKANVKPNLPVTARDYLVQKCAMILNAKVLQY